MKLEIKIPSPGESITEVELASWFVEDGDIVTMNQEVGEIESEKATLPLIADKAGQIKILIQEGATANVGDVACIIDTAVQPEGAGSEKEKASASAAAADSEGKSVKASTSSAEADTAEAEGKSIKAKGKSEAEDKISPDDKIKITPVAREMMEAEGLSLDDILSGLKKITTGEVKAVIDYRLTGIPTAPISGEASREEDRKKISQLRKKISERLVAVKNETAMLTTFNEADMSAIMSLRKKYQDQFVEKHGIKLGFMSFFTRAVTEALKLHPNVNSFMDGEEIVTPAYYDIGIAVQTDKGLMVPVIRNTETLGLADIEKYILDLAGKARKARLSIEEMTGGTFTITNGGIFGSMLSTPILNPPQSAILGMHNIVERPVAVNGKVEIRPMMYLALSYDHRVIDGRDSVSFLKTVKEFIEEPGKMLFGGSSQDEVLLGI